MFNNIFIWFTLISLYDYITCVVVLIHTSVKSQYYLILVIKHGFILIIVIIRFFLKLYKLNLVLLIFLTVVFFVYKKTILNVKKRFLIPVLTT